MIQPKMSIMPRSRSPIPELHLAMAPKHAVCTSKKTGGRRARREGLAGGEEPATKENKKPGPSGKAERTWTLAAPS